MPWFGPDSVFMAVFCVFALVLWVSIVGAQGLVDAWQAENTWVWATRLAQPATVLGTMVVIAQLVILIREQERTTRALLRIPRLLVGLGQWSELGQQAYPSLVVIAFQQVPNQVGLLIRQIGVRIITENIGDRTAHHVKWTVLLPPGLPWDFSGEGLNAKRRYQPGGDVGVDDLDTLHPTERHEPRLRVDVPLEITEFVVHVRVSMDDAPPSDWSLTVRVLPPD